MANQKFQLQSDPEQARRIIVQNVIDRLIQHGDDYLKKLNSLNEKFQTPFQYNQSNN